MPACELRCASTHFATPTSQGKAPHPNESRVFWWSLYFNTFFWGLLAFLALLKLHFGYLVRTTSASVTCARAHPSAILRLSAHAPLCNLQLAMLCPSLAHANHPHSATTRPQLLCGVAVSLNLSNVIGYWKCDSDAKKKLSQAAARMVGEYGPGLFTTATSYFQSARAAAPAPTAPVGP